MRQGQTQLEQRIEQISQAANQAIDAYNAALSEVLANTRQSWAALTDHDLLALAQQQEAWICGRLPQAKDSRTTVLEALEHATEMHIIKKRACGHDQVEKLLDRLAALVSQRKRPYPLLNTDSEHEEGVA